ncbi:unnamed protein product [Toxocara canis]|uniref:NUDE_C domain-containing protein n=1 Tax=Toxocara canis TaxID=6265 RepID=A0A183V6J5_TOXCA|nr:unnamed protein product [Toxocara canis]
MSENIRAEEAKAELEEHVSYSRQLEAEFDEQLNGMKRDLGVRDRELVKLTAERDRLRVSAFVTSRITSETLTDTERKLNAELEAHALLTTELEMKDELKASSEQCQRLEDEIRDLKLDNTVKDTKIKNWQLVDKNPSLTLRGEKQKEFGKNGLIKLSVTGTEKVLCDNVSKTARLNSAPNESGVASKINSLPSPLARNVSPIIADLLRTIQASVI